MSQKNGVALRYKPTQEQIKMLQQLKYSLLIL